jgi:cell division protein FtsL
MVHRKFERKTILAGALAGLLSVLSLTFYVWHLTENVRLGYEINQGERRLRALNVDIKRLRTRKAALLSLERVEKTARRELKLADPREDQIIYENR